MAEDPNDWDIETKSVRGGMARSPYGEISEALFLTQSFAYDSAASADERFAGNAPGFIYQRFGNPTTQMFEDRLALLEGAEQCKSTASGMAAIHLSLMGLLRAGDHLVAGRALFGSCRWIISEWLPRFGPVSIGLTSGASTPDNLVELVIRRLNACANHGVTG